ncbi:hypothetical protein BGZ57DRAFT_963056 [Hyaloscypha finlandica]|nr:hypothetical protein BGZ57DRAFT_963056 [Hyaloscypha finlandica]
MPSHPTASHPQVSNTTVLRTGQSRDSTTASPRLAPPQSTRPAGVVSAPRSYRIRTLPQQRPQPTTQRPGGQALARAAPGLPAPSDLRTHAAPCPPKEREEKKRVSTVQRNPTFTRSLAAPKPGKNGGGEGATQPLPERKLAVVFRVAADPAQPCVTSLGRASKHVRSRGKGWRYEGGRWEGGREGAREGGARGCALEEGVLQFAGFVETRPIFPSHSVLYVRREKKWM